MLSQDLVKLYDIDGDEVVGEMTLYKNQTLVQEDIFNEIYFIFKRKVKKNSKKNLDKLSGNNRFFKTGHNTIH